MSTSDNTQIIDILNKAGAEIDRLQRENWALIQERDHFKSEAEKWHREAMAADDELGRA